MMSCWSRDMLYLSPSMAHDGTAVDMHDIFDRFRAASHTELGQAFLDHLRDELAFEGRYADPDLQVSREPARVAPAMQRRVAGAL